MELLRQNNTIVAGLEAERLKPYFNALATQLAKDIEAAPLAKLDRARLALLAKPDNLTTLFNTVACRTGNTILSEIVIAPDSLFGRKDVMEGNTKFFGHYAYEGHGFTLGFLQIFTHDKKTSTSIPLFAFDEKMMATIEPFESERLLQAFQTVMTASNHDMLHHYTNETLNPAIAKTSRALPMPQTETSIRQWGRQFFNAASDTALDSYEGWLILNHARISRLMREDSAENEKLRGACDQFFDELNRIGQAMVVASPPGQAHVSVDYFGTLLCFALMRFMPLDHPLLNHAIERLQQADPDAGAVINRKQAIMLGLMHKKKPDIRCALHNYQEEGLTLASPDPDYGALKRLQLVLIAPEIARLLSPAPPETDLARIKARVGIINRDMISAVAEPRSWHISKR